MKEGETYTIVNTQGYQDKLETHPSIVENPDSYEIVDEEIPTIQYLNYSPFNK